MGCWLETCGVSSLAILPEDRVRLLVLQEERFKESQSWTLRCIPIEGSYNYYGTIHTPKTSLLTRLIFQRLNEALLEEKPATLKEMLSFLVRKDLHLSCERGTLQIGSVLVLEEVYQKVVEIGGSADAQAKETFERLRVCKTLSSLAGTGVESLLRDVESPVSMLAGGWSEKPLGECPILERASQEELQTLKEPLAGALAFQRGLWRLRRSLIPSFLQHSSQDEFAEEQEAFFKTVLNLLQRRTVKNAVHNPG